MGHISFVGKLDGESLKAGAPAIAPGFTLEIMGQHSLDFWLTSEDLPDPNNRVTLDREGNIVLSYPHAPALPLRRNFDPRWPHGGTIRAPASRGSAAAGAPCAQAVPAGPFSDLSLRNRRSRHIRGTRYGIRRDDDGLLLAGKPGVQLTWMDAKIGNWASRCGTASLSRSRPFGIVACA